MNHIEIKTHKCGVKSVHFTKQWHLLFNQVSLSSLETKLLGLRELPTRHDFWCVISLNQVFSFFHIMSQDWERILWDWNKIICMKKSSSCLKVCFLSVSHMQDDAFCSIQINFKVIRSSGIENSWSLLLPPEACHKQYRMCRMLVVFCALPYFPDEITWMEA